VVSLWNANDSGVTDQLMEDFYTNLTSGEHQGDKAQSLRKAMLQQLEDGNLNPAAWAAFTLIGEAE
jgi:CHAT domain-containing protein